MDSVLSWVVLSILVTVFGLSFIIKAVTEYEQIKREEREFWKKRGETWD